MDKQQFHQEFLLPARELLRCLTLKDVLERFLLACLEALLRAQAANDDARTAQSWRTARFNLAHLAGREDMLPQHPAWWFLFDEFGGVEYFGDLVKITQKDIALLVTWRYCPRTFRELTEGIVDVEYRAYFALINDVQHLFGQYPRLSEHFQRRMFGARWPSTRPFLSKALSEWVPNEAVRPCFEQVIRRQMPFITVLLRGKSKKISLTPLSARCDVPQVSRLAVRLLSEHFLREKQTLFRWLDLNEEGVLEQSPDRVLSPMPLLIQAGTVEKVRKRFKRVKNKVVRDTVVRDLEKLPSNGRGYR